MTPLYDSTMLELSHRVGKDPTADRLKKHEGGRVTMGLVCRQYRTPRKHWVSETDLTVTEVCMYMHYNDSADECLCYLSRIRTQSPEDDPVPVREL